MRTIYSKPRPLAVPKTRRTLLDAAATGGNRTRMQGRPSRARAERLAAMAFQAPLGDAEPQVSESR